MLIAEVAFKAEISGCTNDALIFLVGDVTARLRAQVPFGQPKVDQVYCACFLTLANHYILWFHVTMNEIFLVQVLQARYHLDTDA